MNLLLRIRLNSLTVPSSNLQQKKLTKISLIPHNVFIPIRLTERQRIRTGLQMATLCHHATTTPRTDSHVRSGSAIFQAERHRTPTGQGENARIGSAHQKSEGREKFATVCEPSVQRLRQNGRHAGRSIGTVHL